jgi:hypothetical protein
MPSDVEERDRIATVLWNALLSECRKEGHILNVGAALDALMMLAALLLAYSKDNHTPEEISAFVDFTAARMKLRIADARQDPILPALFGRPIRSSNVH